MSARYPVVLSATEADVNASLLSDYARYLWEHSRRTQSAAIREHCTTRATQCRDLEAAIVRRSYTIPEERHAELVRHFETLQPAKG